MLILSAGQQVDGDNDCGVAARERALELMGANVSDGHLFAEPARFGGDDDGPVLALDTPVTTA